jgi:hypothetical protein
MRHSHTTPYPSSYYDDEMCLKPPLMSWLAVLFLSRGLTLPIAMGIGHYAGVDSRALDAIRAYWSADSLLPALIAVVILYVLCRRSPNSQRWVRWIWARGQILLAASAILDIGLLLNSAVHQGEIINSSLSSIAAAAVDLYFLVYILAAPRARDSFAEFPAPLDKLKKP